MIALFFLAADIEPVNTNSVPAPMDWTAQVAPEKKTQDYGFDPNAKVLNSPGMCVILAGQPLPDCANPNQPIALNDEIFGTGVGGADSTCQTVETLQKDANGQTRKVFATFCGDEVMRSDFKFKQSPSSLSLPLQPTDRAIGPNEVGSLN